MFYQPEVDDSALRATLAAEPELRAQAFDRLRREYRVRREMQATRFGLPAGNQPLRLLAEALELSWQEI